MVLRMYMAIMVLLVARCQHFVDCGNDTSRDSTTLPQPGRITNLNADIIIGGLFPARLREQDSTKCSQGNSKYLMMATGTGRAQCFRLNPYGMMWIEAMLFALKEINGRSDLLPGVCLGYDIRDTANDVNYAIKSSLDFIVPSERRPTNSTLNDTVRNHYCSCDGNRTKSHVVAVVGGAGSKISKAINYILAVDDIPQISYSSTSPSLSDKYNFPSFFRTIPPDYIQAQVMADLISYYNWTYVSTLATDEDYGRLGIEAFKIEVKTRNVCISVDELFHPDNTQSKAKIRQIVEKLKKDKGECCSVVLRRA
ncbi:hypothetical protein QZH41_001475 [Actinostola sp. cb2023]|nr:hypothetical protein QZH41_001475 [Actinostola sp. cb2023]